jgi:XapX domain-containing protein
MSSSARFAVGLALAVATGFACKISGVPSPAPVAPAGALLVLALTSGYQLAGRFLARRQAMLAIHCGGPTGRDPRKELQS